jgi:maltose/moltooligosaccharide transporter
VRLLKQQLLYLFQPHVAYLHPYGRNLIACQYGANIFVGNETIWNTVDTASAEYQAAGDWTGVLFAVQAIGSILWAMVLPMFRNVKMAYSSSLVLGALGFISAYFVHDQHMLFVSFLLIGCAWAAMLALPFAMLTNSLSGKSLGSYMGLFNCTICLPQIIASLVGGLLLGVFGGEVVNGVQTGQIAMFVVAGVSLLLAAIAVFGISTKRAE